MIDENYLTSIFKKIEILFLNKEILNVLYVKDEDDDLLDNVIFLEMASENVVGVYVNGMNPIFSMSHFEQFDSFNLYERYSKLTECKVKEVPSFKIGAIKLAFNSEYNELIGIYLSDVSSKSSLFMIFSQDEISLEKAEEGIKELIVEKSNHMSLENILIYERSESDVKWRVI